MKQSPLEWHFQKKIALEEAMYNLRNDFTIGSSTEAARTLTLKRMELIKEKQEALEKRLDLIMMFIKHRQIMKEDAPGPIVWNNDEKYRYFNRVFADAPYDFIYGGEKVCDICERMESTSRGIVYALDPQTGDLVSICDDCYIDRSNETV